MSDHLVYPISPPSAPRPKRSRPCCVAAIWPCRRVPSSSTPNRANPLRERLRRPISRAASGKHWKCWRRIRSTYSAWWSSAWERLGELSEADWVNLGGLVHAQITARKTATASLIAEWPSEDKGTEAKRDAAQIVADLAFGALLRSYAFKKYRTKRRDDEESRSEAGAGEGSAPERDGLATLVVQCADPRAAEAAFSLAQSRC